MKKDKGTSQVLTCLRNLKVMLPHASTFRQSPQVQLLKPSNETTKGK